MSASTLYISIDHLVRSTESIPGGYTGLFFMDIKGIASIGPADPLTGLVNSIAIKTGYSFSRAYVPASGRQYTEEQKNSDAGPYMAMRIEAFYPFETIDMLRFTNNMKMYKYALVLSTLTPGFYRFLGTPDNPATFSHSYNSGKGFKSIPGTTLVFEWENEDRAPMRSV